MTKIILIGTFCLLLFAFSAFAQDGVKAIVNNEVVTKDDLESFINFMRIQMAELYSTEEVNQRINQMLPDLLERLIEDRLILQAASKENIIIEPTRIRARIDEIKKNYSSDADFENALASQGLVLADLQIKLKEQLLMFEIINRKIRSKVKVNPQEVTDYYLVHAQDFIEPEQLRVVYLSIKDPPLIERIKKDSSSKPDLDKIAGNYSLEIVNLGWVTRSQLKPEIANAVLNLKAGESSELLNQDDNFYIFKVEESKPETKLSLSEVQGKIYNLIFEKRMQESLVEWLNELKSKAYIVIKKDG